MLKEPKPEKALVLVVLEDEDDDDDDEEWYELLLDLVTILWETLLLEVTLRVVWCLTVLEDL